MIGGKRQEEVRLLTLFAGDWLEGTGSWVSRWRLTSWPSINKSINQSIIRVFLSLEGCRRFGDHRMYKLKGQWTLEVTGPWNQGVRGCPNIVVLPNLDADFSIGNHG